MISAQASITVPRQTALHQTPYLQPRIIIKPYPPASRRQREHQWQQRLGSLFAKQRY